MRMTRDEIKKLVAGLKIPIHIKALALAAVSGATPEQLEKISDLWESLQRGDTEPVLDLCREIGIPAPLTKQIVAKLDEYQIHRNAHPVQ